MMRSLHTSFALYLLTALCLLATSCSMVRKDVAKSPTAVVPDKAFRTLLTEKGYAQKVYGNRMKATEKGLAMKELSCYEQGIHSLRGIQLFPQLSTLVCSGNPITELDLNSLPLLENLYGIHMPLQHLSIDSCHQLKKIELSYTELDTFDLHPFPNLTYFFCIFSPLHGLDLSPCPKLNTVYVRGTQIEQLDISSCPLFWQLFAEDTPLKRLRVTTDQYMSDRVMVSCPDNTELDILPWEGLSPLTTRAVLLPEAAAMGITLDTLEPYYPNGMSLLGDSVPQEYLMAWQQFVLGVRNALLEASMNWDEPYRLWGRAFFAPDGTVDHYLYNWNGSTQPSDEWKNQFREVLENYLDTFRYAYPMRRRFAQCGGIRFTPAQ